MSLYILSNKIIIKFIKKFDVYNSIVYMKNQYEKSILILLTNNKDELFLITYMLGKYWL